MSRLQEITMKRAVVVCLSDNGIKQFSIFVISAEGTYIFPQLEKVASPSPYENRGL